MKRYEAYKDSGVEWLGEIPTHWEVKKLKWVGAAIIGITYRPENVVETKNDGRLVLRSSNIQNGKLSFLDNVYVNQEVNEKHICRAGDILLCARNGSAHLVGKCVLISETDIGYTFGAFMSVFRSQSGFFLRYFFESDIFKKQSGIFSTSTINQLTTDTLHNLITPLPPLAEQTTIAEFLDRKTSQIDSLVEKKKRLIELLKEEKTAVINQAVTKGIDPNVKMKDSGVEWLGEIPEHWEVKKLKWVADLKSGESITADDIRPEGDFPVYGGNGLRGYTDQNTHDGEFVLIGRQGALCGNINYAKDKFYASEHAVVVTILKNLDFVWLGELLRSMNLNQYSIASAQPGLSVDRVKNLLIPVPPTEEANLIRSFVLKQTFQIDSTISKIEKEIELLHEYRTALISEVVTGKVKVGE